VKRWLLALALFGCGDDDYGPYNYLGGPCRNEFDCAPGVRCQGGGDFPDGTCALPCRDYRDCPQGTACADVHGGLCLVRCANELQCRPGYRCRDRNDRNSDTSSLVCMN
jgi:hypothetical protein